MKSVFTPVGSGFVLYEFFLISNAIVVVLCKFPANVCYNPEIRFYNNDLCDSYWIEGRKGGRKVRKLFEKRGKGEKA
jgi:hypothetical protein